MYFGVGHLGAVAPRGSGGSGFQPLSGASLDMWFATSQYFGAQLSDLTVTRATPALAYADTAAGALQGFAANVPRVTTKGLLIEETRANLDLQTQVFDDAVWTKNALTIGVNAFVAPDGTTTADGFIDDVTNALHSVQQSGISFSSGNIYTFSVFAKKAGTVGEQKLIQLCPAIAAFSSGPYANFDLDLGTVTSTGGTVVAASIVPYTNGWYRCILAVTATASTTSNHNIIRIQNPLDVRAPSYSGSGTSLPVWGSQCETGGTTVYFATSYIPNTTVSQTRATDVVVLAGTPFSNINTNAAACSTYCEMQPLAANANNPAQSSYIAASNNSNNNRIYGARVGNTASLSSLVSQAGAATNPGPIPNTFGPTFYCKFMTAVTTGDAQSCANQALSTTAAPLAMPTLNRLYIGADPIGGNPGSGYFARIAFFPSRVSAADMQAFTAIAVQAVGGIAIGTPGTGVLAGFNMVYGDDFGTLPTQYTNTHNANKYASSTSVLGFRRNQGVPGTATADAMIYLDPYFRGYRSQSPTDLGYVPNAVASSVLTITAQAAPGPLVPFLPPGDYSLGGGDAQSRPLLYSACLNTWPDFMINAKGDFAVEMYAQFPPGTINAYWPAYWVHGSDYPSDGEIDVVELFNSATTRNQNTTLHIPNVVGGDNVSTNIVANEVLATGRFIQFLMVKQGNTITIYDDNAVAGTLATKGTYTDAARVGGIKGAFQVRIELALNGGIGSGAFTIGQMPTTYQLDWFRVWLPAGSQAPSTLNILPVINTAPGGSWAASIGSQTALYGKPVDAEVVFSGFDNFDNPGMPLRRNHLPGGCFWDSSLRTLSGTVPTTEGGRTGVFFTGTFNAGGSTLRAIQYFNVAPAVQTSLFPNRPCLIGAAFSQGIAASDFHSGNLGPHTYVVSKVSGGADFTISGNGTDTITISAATVVTNQASVFSIACTNSIGQTTTVQRTLQAVTAQPVFMDFVNDSYYYNGSSYASIALALASSNFTFTRANTGYYIDQWGYVTLVGSGTLRRGNWGARLEYARNATVMLSQSMNTADLTNTFFTGMATTTVGNVTAPDGSSTGNTQFTDTANSTHLVGKNATTNNYVSGSFYQFSTMVAANTARYVQITPPAAVASGLPYLNVDLLTGAFLTGGSGGTGFFVRPLANGFWWIGFNFTATASSTAGTMQLITINSLSDGRNPTYVGTGLSVKTWESMNSAIASLSLPQTTPAPATASGITSPVAQAADALGGLLPAGTYNMTVTLMDGSTQQFTGLTTTWALTAANLNSFDVRSIAITS